MGSKLITKTIEIDAPAEIVWDILISPEFTSAISYEMMQGEMIKGEYKPDGIIEFRDKSGSGIKAQVTEFKYKEVLKYGYIGTFTNGKEDTDGVELKKWEESYDKFMLKGENGMTIVTLESMNPEEYYDTFMGTWETSMKHIKDFSEWTLGLLSEGFSGVTVVGIPEENSDEHTHDIPTAHIVLFGDLKTKDENGEKTYQPGEKVIFPAGTTHIAWATKPDSLMLVGFKH